MSRKVMTLVLVGAFVFTLAACAVPVAPITPTPVQITPAPAPGGLYPAIMADSLLYHWTREDLPPIDIDESDYLGVTSSAPPSEWPKEDGQSNWLTVGSPYARYGWGIIALNSRENVWEMFKPWRLPRGIWVLGVLPDEEMREFVKENADGEIMQAVLRYEYDGKKLTTLDLGYFQGEFRGFSKGGDFNVNRRNRQNALVQFLNPAEMINTNLLEDAWKDNEIFRLVYYWMPDLRTRYFLAVSDRRIVILDEWMTSPNEEFSISPEEVTSEAMLEKFQDLFAGLKGESMVNILETME